MKNKFSIFASFLFALPVFAACPQPTGAGWYNDPNSYQVKTVKFFPPPSSSSSDSGYVAFSMNGKDFVYRFTQSEWDISKGFLSILLTSQALNRKVKAYVSDTCPSPDKFSILVLDSLTYQ